MKRLYNITVLIIVILSISTFPVFAQTGFEGMACYRDGVLGGVEWHSGIMVKPAVNYSSPIVHIAGSGYTVTTCSFTTFKDGNNFEGIYEPYGVSSGDLDYAKNMALDLTSEGISYTAYNMISHSATDTWIFPEDIIKLRCDGVVEYCYEYYGIEVQAAEDNYGNYHWDISSTEDAPYHSTNYGMSPWNQALNMDFVDSDGL